MTTKVYKLVGEAYEITEEEIVFTSEQKAKDYILQWESWLGMSSEEALSCEEVRIVEWELVDD